MNESIYVRFIAVWILALASTGCSCPAAAPKALNTTPASPTIAPSSLLASTDMALITPIVTGTSTPTATATIKLRSTSTSKPTTTSTATFSPASIKFVDGKYVMSDEAYYGLTDFGQYYFSKRIPAGFLAGIALYNAMLEYSLHPEQLANVYALRAEAYEQLGHYELAREDYLIAQKLATREIKFLNNLCWNYAINNLAQDALPYCEEAVKLASSASNLNSRGVVYALLGRLQEAQNDFEAALKRTDFRSDLKAQRQGWVTTLKAGKNPITPDVLRKELNEEHPLTSVTFYAGDIELSDLRREYEDSGFLFEKITIDGQGGQIGTLQKAKCKAEIVLIGDEEKFKSEIGTILDCSEDDARENGDKFIMPFCADSDEFFRIIVWGYADWYEVIDGKDASDLTQTCGGFEFKVVRTSVGGSEGIIITAKPAH